MTALATSPARTSIRRRGTAQTQRPRAVDEGVDRVLGARRRASPRRRRRPVRRPRARFDRATTATPRPALPNRGFTTTGYGHAPGRPAPRRAVAWRTVGKPWAASQSWVAACRRRSRTSSGDEMATVVPTAARSSRAAASTGNSVIDRRHDEVDIAARGTAPPCGRRSRARRSPGPGSRASALCRALEYQDRSAARTRPSRPRSWSAARKPRSSSTPPPRRRHEDGHVRHSRRAGSSAMVA